MKKMPALTLLSLGSLLSGYATANNGDQMVGLSGITNAMGGAVVASPQDVTTSLSNPAGLSYLNLGDNHTRFDMSLALLNPNRRLNGVDSSNDTYVMATGGFAFRSDLLGEKFTIGIGAYPVSGGGVDFPNSAYSHPLLGDRSIVASRQSLRIGPSIAWEMNDQLSVGANLSLVSNMMSLKSPSFNFPSDVAYGASFVVGFIYQPSQNWRVGGAYTSRSYSENLSWNMDDGTYELDFEDPATISLGVSYSPNPDIEMELDVKWLDYSDVRSANILHTPESMPDQILAYGWDDQYVIALGIKYKPTGQITLYGGYNYGESPIEEDDINSNIGATAIVEHHLSVGASVEITRFSTLTFSWIHGFENDMRATGIPPTEVSFETNLVTLQFTYRH